jgi:hypothetical protein
MANLTILAEASQDWFKRMGLSLGIYAGKIASEPSDRLRFGSTEVSSGPTAYGKCRR